MVSHKGKHHGEPNFQRRRPRHHACVFCRTWYVLGSRVRSGCNGYRFLRCEDCFPKYSGTSVDVQAPAGSAANSAAPVAVKVDDRRTVAGSGDSSVAAQSPGNVGAGAGKAPSTTVQPTVAGEVTTSPTIVDFGDVLVGTSAEKSVKIFSRSAKIPVGKEDFVATGTYSLPPATACTEISPTGGCVVAISFKPHRIGVAEGTLTIKTVAVNGGAIALIGRGVSDDLSSRDQMWSRLWPVLAFVLIYLVALVAVRWNFIAYPSRGLLVAQISNVRARLGAGSDADRNNLNNLLNQAAAIYATVGEGRLHRHWNGFCDVLFWSRGQESAGWGIIHEVEEQMVKLLTDEEVTTQLQTIKEDMKALDSKKGGIFEARVDDVTKNQQPNAPLLRKALLSAGLVQIYEARDADYATLVSWHSKAMWLVFSGLFLIVGIGIAIGSPILLLVGAVGGLLSRLQRALYRESMPTDYGASWTSLFLSPIVGALTGWAGILLLDAAADLKLIGDLFRNAWHVPTAPLTLACAVIFGFSERLFNGILNQLETKINTKPGQAQTQQQAPANAAKKPLAVKTAPLPTFVAGQPCVVKPEAEGGQSPYRFTWSGQPNWLTLGADGVLRGTAQQGGPYQLTLNVQDVENTSVDQKFELRIA